MEISFSAYNFGHLITADLLDCLRDLPLVSVGVKKHKDAVSIELVDRFKQNLQSRFFYRMVNFHQIGYQEGQRGSQAARTLANLLNPYFMLVMKLI